jgi:hypothetical protein
MISQTATPQHPFTQSDFERLGVRNWQHWLDKITTENL